MSLAPDPVLLDVTPSGVAIVTLNRPGARNAIDATLVAGLAEVLETLRGADHVRIVFLRGAGDSFCSGADAAWFADQAEHQRGDIEDQVLDFARALKALHELPQLTVALIHGAALGGGAGLAAACDVAVATADAQFRFPEVRMGTIPGAVAPYVVEAIGARAARALFASGMPFDARQALALGLVQRVVEDAVGLESAMREFGGYSLEAAPGAAAAAKRLVREIAGRKLDDGIARETARQSAAVWAGDEAKEGAAARLEKRPPGWDRG